MAKDAYYFSHDCNARNDDKLIAVRMKFGAEGYGIFFMILERLMESSKYMSVKDYNIIAFDLRVDAAKVKSIIEDFGLFVFTEDGKYFYSESFNRRMVPLDNIKEQRSQAGKKSAEKRAKKNNNSTTVERPLNKNSTKESKVKESKDNISHTACVRTGENFPPSDIFDINLNDCHNELSHDNSWREPFVMNVRGAGFNDFTLEEFDRYLNLFFAKLQNDGETMKSIKDAKKHFNSWIRIELKSTKKNGKQEKEPNIAGGRPVKVRSISFG